MESRYDVVISGAGPSGSLLGYFLSREGINTMIVERQEFPRYKICAGGLQHRSLALIPFDIKKVIQKSLNGILFTYKGKDSFKRRYNASVIHTVDRREFDKFLADKAIEGGCEIAFDEKVIGYEHVKGGLKINTDKRSLQAKVIVGADGIRGTVHRHLTYGSKILKILGYELEKKASQLEKEKYGDSVGLDFGGIKKGYVWAFPKKDIISYGIGGPFSSAVYMKRYFNQYLNRSGGMDTSRIMAQSIPIKTEQTPVCGSRVLAVGDAACLGDGFTGEGLYNALRSSRIAARSIRDALSSSTFDFEDYDKQIRDEIFEDIKMSLTFSRIFFLYPLFFYKLLKTNKNFFILCCQVLRGEKKYSDIYGKLNLFKR